MITKYKTNYLKDNIEVVQILRETNEYVFFIADDFSKGGRQEKKMSSSGAYFDTWLEAHNYLMDCAHKSVNVAEIMLENAMKTLRKVEELQITKHK